MGNGIILSKDVQNTIQVFSSDTLSSIVQFDNINELLHSDIYKQGVNQFSAYLSGSVMRRKSADFHQSLAWYEKLGFISESKKMDYEKSMERAGKTTALVTNMALNTVPYVVSSFSTNADKKNIKDFFITGMGYINKNSEITSLMVMNTKSLLSAAGVHDLSAEQIREKIQKSQNRSGSLMHLSRRNRSSMNSVEESQMLSVMKTMISTADLYNNEIKERALEFVVEVFNLTYNEAEKKLVDIMAAQEHLSQFLEFSSFDYLTFFQNFIFSFEEAQKIGAYDVNMDVYAKKRRENKEAVFKITKDVAEIAVKAGVSYITGDPMPFLSSAVPAKDIIQLSENLMSSTLNPDISPETGMQLMKKIAERRRVFNV